MRRLRTNRRPLGLLCAALLALVLVAHPRPAAAETEGAGWWIAAVGASLLYTPIKAFTAAGGAVLGTGAWLVLGGDDQAARDILLPAVRGDYWVEPDHLQGEDHLRFMGR